MDRVGGLQEQLRAFSCLPPPEKFCATLEFFGLPTRGRRAREVNIAAFAGHDNFWLERRESYNAEFGDSSRVCVVSKHATLGVPFTTIQSSPREPEDYLREAHNLLRAFLVSLVSVVVKKPRPSMTVICPKAANTSTLNRRGREYRTLMRPEETRAWPVESKPILSRSISRR
jgi:hypothetical protein